jgi:steroid 5-alpha reductase family enzyme
LGGIGLMLAFLTLMVIIVQAKKDNTIGNFTWGGMAILGALYTFFTTSAYLPRQCLVTGLIVIWGLRLTIYLYSRYKKGADPRFIAWQAQWGHYALLISIAWIAVMQATLGVIMALPGVWANTHLSLPLNSLDLFGTIVWAVGFFFESVGDYQLYWFMKNPANKGHIMTQGLWHYTRHPNYFGEILMWWGIYAILLSVPGGVWTIISPITITILLVFVTGVPWAEAVFKDNPYYQAYKEHTSMLIPWFAKD